MWTNLRGNHTWVEVWDGGWHFTGAAEYDPKGLDRGWFVADAAQAKKDEAEHAIYAASFRRTSIHFPLVWDRKSREVSAENVTGRYTTTVGTTSAQVRVLFRLHEAGTRKRLVQPVLVLDAPASCEVCRGRSTGETADLNDMLHFDLLP